MPAFRPKEYVVPRSIGEAIAVLKAGGLDAKIVAGGTEFNELAKRGMLPHVMTVVDIESLGLDYLKENERGLSVGATFTIARLMNDPRILNNPAYHAIRDATRRIQPIQVKNVATIGGALCSSLPFLDLPTAVIAVDGIIKTAGPSGGREIPSDQFFLDSFLPNLRTGELLTEVRLPRFSERTVSGFDKLQLSAEDLALVNVAACLTTAASGHCLDARIVFAGRGTVRVPSRAKAAERALVGAPLDDAAIDRVALIAVNELRPISDHRATAEYRRRIASVMLARLLKRMALGSGAEG